MDISLRQLQVFLAVAEHGGFTRAATVLNVSQPAVTKTVRDVEVALGVILFERLPRGTVLTRAGEVLARRARSIAAELRQADSELAAMAGPGGGRLSIGTAPIGSGDYVPRAVMRLADAHPGLSVSIREGGYSDLLPVLRAGDLDLVFGPVPDSPPEDLAIDVMLHDGFSIIARAGHPLAGLPSLGFAHVAQCDWVLPPKDVPPRRMYEAVIRTAGFEPPDSGIETFSISAIRALLLGSDRVTLLPRSVVRIDIENGLLVDLPIELRGSARPIGLMTRRASEPSPEASAFSEALRTVVGETRPAP